MRLSCGGTQDCEKSGGEEVSRLREHQQFGSGVDLQVEEQN
jgi:hypothetical protein